MPQQSVRRLAMKTYTSIPVLDPLMAQNTYRRIRLAAMCGACVILTFCFTVIAFFVARIEHSYTHAGFKNDAYYASMALLLSSFAIYSTCVAFNVLLVLGIYHTRVSYIFMWLVSALGLYTLELSHFGLSIYMREKRLVFDPYANADFALFVLHTLVLIYSVTTSLLLYKAMKHRILCSQEEREILL